jgi:hypothetical protein
MLCHSISSVGFHKHKRMAAQKRWGGREEEVHGMIIYNF